MNRKNLKKLFFLFILYGLLIGAYLQIQSFDIYNSGLMKNGLPLIGYIISQIYILVTYFFVIWITGIFFTKKISANLNGIDTVNFVLIITVSGSVVLGTLMLILGAFNLLYSFSALAICLTALSAYLFFPNYFNILEINKRLTISKFIKSKLNLLFLILIAILAVFLIVNRGLTLAEFDNDIWEYYLHYYKLVLNNHNIYPNEVWAGYYLLKFSGLFYFASLLGNLFSIQLVSLFCIFQICLITYSLIKISSNSDTLALSGICIFIVSLNDLNGNAGSFLKLHTLTASTILSILWCTIFCIISSNKSIRRTYTIIGCLSAIYLGIYSPVSSIIILLFFIIQYFFVRKNYPINIAIKFLLSSLVGIFISIITNQLITGLLTDTPIGLTIKFLNRSQFSKYWDPLVLRYWFLDPISVESNTFNLSTILNIDLDWYAKILRLSYLQYAFYLFGIFFFSLFLWNIYTNCRNKFIYPYAKYRRFQIIPSISIASLLLSSVIISQPFVGSASIFRLYSFTLSLSLSFVLITGYIFTFPHRKEGAFFKIAMLCVTAISAFNIFNANTSISRLEELSKYLTGSISTLNLIISIESYYPHPLSINSILKFRKEVGNEGKILSLTYSPGPSYFMPNPPIVSEPQYAFGKDYSLVLFGNSKIQKDILKDKLNIRYIIFNTYNRLFLGIPYSQLFKKENIGKYFGLAWSEGEIFILGWKDDGFETPIPATLINILEYKKTGLSNELDSLEANEHLKNHLKKMKRGTNQSSDYYDWLYEFEFRKYLESKDQVTP